MLCNAFPDKDTSCCILNKLQLPFRGRHTAACYNSQIYNLWKHALVSQCHVELAYFFILAIMRHQSLSDKKINNKKNFRICIMSKKIIKDLKHNFLLAAKICIYVTNSIITSRQRYLAMSASKVDTGGLRRSYRRMKGSFLISQISRCLSQVFR